MCHFPGGGHLCVLSTLHFYMTALVQEDWLMPVCEHCEWLFFSSGDGVFGEVSCSTSEWTEKKRHRQRGVCLSAAEPAVALSLSPRVALWVCLQRAALQTLSSVSSINTPLYLDRDNIRPHRLCKHEPGQEVQSFRITACSSGPMLLLHQQIHLLFKWLWRF